ncbi:hypothetical protein [Burkholderia pseudomallei]|uniref:hypothetical protein n=1 Tax=Burkholderia pseudomallei TaxID=28450 RepID=UPI0003C09F42|nr:hypothetical protein [Burkholderia pseudomallei]AGZ32298.1 hypothetical protein BBK_4808 [Burkholderia pseudomallei NCTC 13179]
MIIGSVITEDIVRQDPRYVNKKTITLSDISAYALEQQSVNSTEALKKVNAMKEEYGNGISALVRIYNASGEAVSLAETNDWHGHIWKYPVDTIIENGQWSVFLYVHASSAAVGVCSAVVYRAAQAEQDIFLGWESPYIGNNSVYVESRETNHWPNVGSWNYMEHKINDDAGSSSSSKWGVIKVTGQIGQSSSPVVDFVITHPREER